MVAAEGSAVILLSQEWADSNVWSWCRRGVLHIPQLQTSPVIIPHRVPRSWGNFEDYMKWRGRRNKGNLMSGMIAEVAVPRWKQWVEGQGHKGSAILAGGDV